MPRRQVPGVAGPRSAPVIPFGAPGDERHRETGNPGSERSGAPSARPLKLVAAYARVSSDRQDKEQTIDSQVDALRRAAEQRGWHLAPDLICLDEGRSGATLARPGLDRLRDLVAEGTCATVLVCAPDRLARSYAYQVLVIDEFERAGCEVAFLNHAFDDSPEQQMLLQMQGVFAEYERALIQDRTRRGRLFWARRGRVNWGGTPTYGYRLSGPTEPRPRRLVVEESEAAVVRQLYRWLVEEQLSSYAIQKRLSEREVPTRKGGGRGWSQSTVIQILSNSSYKGEGWYNRRRAADRVQPRGKTGFKDLRPGDRRSQSFRPVEEWIPVPVPAIIDADLWRLAQEQLARNRERATRNNTRHQYLLSALLICGRCGRRMAGATDGGGRRRYVCSARYPRHVPGACDGRSTTAEPLEDQVWRWVTRLLSDPSLLRAHFEESRGDPAVDGADEREGARIERQLKALDREVGRLIDAYQAAAIELDELKERRRQVEDHARHRRERLDEIRRRRSEREREIRLLQGLEAFCAGIRDALLDPPFEIRQKVLRLVIDRVILADDKVVVRHIVPMTPLGLQPYPGPAQELPRRGPGDEAGGRAVALHPAPARALAQ
jgi:site-specific DNA recombinase